MSLAAATPALLATLWLLAALALARVPLRWRPATGWTLATLGVPLLGALTYLHGPLAGVAALTAGATLLALAFRPQKGHPAE